MCKYFECIITGIIFVSENFENFLMCLMSVECLKHKLVDWIYKSNNKKIC